MSEHVGYIIQIKELNKHPNADRLQIATIFGASVIVDLSVKIDDIGVYFPIDLQLSEEYCNQNNLTRKLDSEGNNIGGYLDPNKRNIRAMRFRGSKSEGLYMPLESLKYTGKTKYEVGETIDKIDSHEICCKYIPKGKNIYPTRKLGNKTRKKKTPIAPLFLEHADTEQLAYNLDAFRPGDTIDITLKMHGTSGRTGYLPTLKGFIHRAPLYTTIANKQPPKNKFLRKIYDYIFDQCTPVYDWGYVTGTRRVVLDNFEGGFYGDNSFREGHAKFFEGKLHKGETVYYEIVGFMNDGTPIMPSVENNKISDKEFSKQYGKTTTFSYGCSPTGEILKHGRDDEGRFAIAKKVPISDCYVYRMTMTNEDGDVIEYSPDYMRYRCEQIGVKYVPLLWKGIIPPEFSDGLVKSDDFLTQEDGSFKEWLLKTPGNYIKDIAEQYYDGVDPIGKTHVREGVVVRIINRPRFCAYKHKNFNFKVLEGIAKDLATEPDIEEAQELESNE